MGRCLDFLSFAVHCLVLAIPLQAQPLRWSAHLSGGVWEGALEHDGYASLSRRLHAHLELGGGLEIPLGTHLAFAPEAGLEYDDMRYNCARGGDPRQLESDLGLFSLKASPGVRFFTDSRLLLRVSPCFLVAVGAMGTFRTTTFISGVGHVTTQYYDHGFGDIRSPVIVGPEVNVGYQWSLRDDLGLALRGSAF